MNKWLPVITRSVVSAAILAAGVAAFLWLGTPEVPTKPPTPDPTPLVVAVPAASHADGITFEVDGVVVPFREIQIAAQVAGKVAFKSDDCRIGRTVKQGDVLLRIEKDDYQLEVRRLEEELEQADAMIRELDAELRSITNQIESSEAQLVIEKRQLQRSKDLVRRGAASDTEVDTARKAELVSQTTLQSQIDQKNLLSQRCIRMESAKSLVQANLDKASLSLSRCEIIAPIDGVIVTESVEQDGYVQIGAPMIVLRDTSRFDVSCKLHMRQMHWLWQTQSLDGSNAKDRAAHEFPETPATVVYELAGERYAWDATADRYEGAGIDAQTRMVPCRIHVDDPTAALVVDDATGRGGRSESDDDDSADTGSLSGEIVGAGGAVRPPSLMSGMFVKVRIHAAPPIDLVRLPQSAVQPGNTVWAVVDGRLAKKSISIASSESDHVVAYQYHDGIKAGDLIVTSPMATPVEGMKVSTVASKEQAIQEATRS